MQKFEGFLHLEVKIMLLFLNKQRVVYHINDSGKIIPFTGKYTTTDMYGKKNIECTFMDGRLHGELVEYNPATGLILSQYHFINGKRDGLQYRYHSNGNLLIEAEYTCGIPHGMYKLYSDYGHLIQSKRYQFGNYYHN